METGRGRLKGRERSQTLTVGSEPGDEALRAADKGGNVGLKAEELHRTDHKMQWGVIIQCTSIQQMKEDKVSYFTIGKLSQAGMPSSLRVFF